MNAAAPRRRASCNQYRHHAPHPPLETHAQQAPEPEPAVDYLAVAEHAGQAVAAGITPESAEGKTALDRIVPPGTPEAERARLLWRLETFTDPRPSGTGSCWQSSTAVSRGRRSSLPTTG
jgi:hypothetical protein